MPSAYCCLPAVHFVVVAIVVIVVCCVHLLLFAFLRLVSGSVAQWCSGAVLGIISFGLLLSLALLQFSFTYRKEMSKNDKVNGCAQNTVHRPMYTKSHTHTHTHAENMMSCVYAQCPGTGYVCGKHKILHVFDLCALSTLKQHQCDLSVCLCVWWL